MDEPDRDEEAQIGTTPANANGGAVRPQRPRSSLPSILFILLMLLLLTSHNGEEYLARHQYQDALQMLTEHLGNYTAWRNGTESNFSLPDTHPSIPLLTDTLLPNNGTLDPFHSSYYSNITGFIHGDVKFYNITPDALRNSSESLSWKPLAEQLMEGVEINSTQLSQALGEWNWSAPVRTSMSVMEKEPELENLQLSSWYNASVSAADKITFVHGRIELTDPHTSEDLRLDIEGVRSHSEGKIYGFGVPHGHGIDIRLVPGLVPEAIRNATALVIESELSARITKLKNMMDAGVIEPSKSTDDETPTNCTFSVFAQLNSVNIPKALMEEYEQEVQQPTGIRAVNPPRLSLKTVLLSRECGMLYEFDDMEGLRSKTFFRKVITYAGTAGIAYLIMLLLLSRQMEKSYTPSGISRVSRWIFLVQSTVDSVSFAGHITFAILAEGRTSLGLIAPAFLTCLTFIYEAQFAMTIYQIQLPEQTVTPSPPSPAVAPPPAVVPNTTSNTADTTESIPNTYPPPPIQPSVPAGTTLPPPVTANNTNNATPGAQSPQSMTFWSFFWHHVRTDPQARMYLMLFVFLTSIVRIILSPTLSFLFVACTYSSIWAPQIWRSIKRGRSSGLTVEYVLGTTACRLYMMLYFLTCPRNVLEVEPRNWAYHLAAFVSLQAIVVVLQECLGPTFFLPKRLSELATVKTYDYHPPLPLPNPDPEQPEQSLGDCSICMDAIIVHVAKDSVVGGGERSRSGGEREERGKEKSDYWDSHSHSTGPSKRKGATSTSGGANVSASASASAIASGGMEILNAVQKGVGNAVTRKSYSLAPCHHLFHTECLERWLAIKNICPQCRRPLPPL
ncbi:hypothetical protein D9758_008759 [Tetrapyrgos nigripes]|uniref:RING-type E3 ubiquitin transferase n=1 Tax=Tetrapyrgos nigripes TaxID=182062 RepID=A0A8H5D439_9AGAR|nr:hypothetical protein D9758_008759 [Tetrapyrgos nigripes]